MLYFYITSLPFPLDFSNNNNPPPNNDLLFPHAFIPSAKERRNEGWE
jgi:hypothetical protein